MAGAASLTACVGLIAPVALEAAERLLAETAGRSCDGGLSIDRRGGVVDCLRRRDRTSCARDRRT
jgi:hypothetical protein